MKKLRNQWVVAALSVSMAYAFSGCASRSGKHVGYGGAWEKKPGIEINPPTENRHSSGFHLRIHTNLAQIGHDIKKMTSREKRPHLARSVSQIFTRKKDNRSIADQDALVDNNR